MPDIKKPVPRLAAVLAAAVAATTGLGALAIGAGAPDAAAATGATVVLHLYQKEIVTTFYNASDVVIQGYPPVGGHVKEDDEDFVGSHLHHAKRSTVSDHLYCTVVSAPANALCFTEFAIGGSLIYSDNVPINLAASSGAIPFDGGTGQYAGYSGQVISTSIGNSNNSDLVVTLHKG
jgi:hypothetical protein